MRRSGAVGFWLTVVIVPLFAQHALHVEASIGFGGFFRIGSWTPVSVSVTSLGSDVSGLLSLQMERGERLGATRHRVVYERPIEVARGDTKAYSFIVPLETSIHPLTVTVTDRDEVAHTERLDLRGRPVSGRLVLVLTRRPSLDFLLPLYNTREERGLELLYSLPEHLPDRWHGYDAADLVVLHDGRLHDLTAPQIAAMRDWIASGGRLVVSGGPHFGMRESGAIVPLGNFAVSAITAAAVGETGFGDLGVSVPEEERGAVTMSSAFAEHGSRIARIPVGRGEIVLLPFDYAQLAGIAPRTSTAMWDALLDGLPADRRIATEMHGRVFESDLLANQLALPIYRFPSRIVVLAFLGFWVLGLAAILAWAAGERHPGRRRLVFPAVAALLALVTAGGHIALTRRMQPVAALALGIERAELAGYGGYAMVTRETALFSRRSAEYSIGYAGSPVIIPMAERAHHVRRQEHAEAQIVTVDRWGHETNVALQVMPFPLRWSVRSGPGYAEIVLTNATRHDISHVVLLRSGVPERLGDLGPGSIVEHLSVERTDAGFAAVVWEDFVADDALRANRARLVGDIARRQRFEGGAAADLIVVGWTDRPLLAASLDAGFRTTVDLHIVTIPIHLEQEQ